MRVLIAEDSPLERLVLQSALEDLGHTCLLAADGTEAWQRFQDEGADVVISDWVMPGLDGPELCRRVRSHDVVSYTYFVFLTSLEDKQHALSGMQSGADDYLVKPLDRDELQRRLIAAERVTALHHALAEARRREGCLAGVRLAARTLHHELGNTLALTMGYAELLAVRGSLPPELQEAAREALRGAEAAMDIVRRLDDVTNIVETHWGPQVGTTIDLVRAVAPADTPEPRPREPLAPA